MKKILVPCDFSKPATNAFRFALDVATQSNGTIHLLNVVELPVISDPMIVPVMTFEQDFVKDLRQKAIEQFDNLISAYNKDNVKVVTAVEYGSPARTIADYATQNSNDIIIMGSHGASGFRELFIGSNAEKVVRHSSVPVLVIKNYLNRPIKNIVFPHTLEVENMQDFTLRVKALQAFFKARLHIVYINTPTNFISDDITYKRLDDFAKRFMFKDFTINVYNDTFEESGILEFAKSMKGDLVAMGTHGRKGISHLLNDSLAEAVVNHSDGAIWTYNFNHEA